MAQSVVGALRVNLGLDSAQFMRGAKQVQTRTQKLGRQMQKVGAAVSAVGAGVALAVRGQLRAVDEIAKTAQSIGVAVDELSQYRHVADLAGASNSELERGLRNTGRTMLNNAERFEDLGVAVHDADGNMRSVVDVFEDTADALSGMEDGAEKTGVAMQLFGERSGPALIPMLNQGSEGIREMRREADALGLTITGETAEAVQNFNDNMARLRGTMSGLARIVTSELAPVLEQISDAAATAAEVFQNLSPEVRRGITAFAGLTVVLGPVLIALGAAIAALSAISAPVLAAVAAVAALTAAAVAFWPQIRAAADAVAGFGEKVVEWLDLHIRAAVDGLKELPGQLFRVGQLIFRELLAGMIATIDGVIEWVRNHARAIADVFRELPAQMVEIGRDVIEGLKDGMARGIPSALESVGLVAHRLQQAIKNPLGIQSPSRVFHEIGQNIMQGLGNGIAETGSQVESTMQNIAGNLSRQISQLFQDVLFQGGSFRRGLSNILGSISGRLFDSAISGILPFADGGRPPVGRASLVGERGPELFVPDGAGTIIPNHQLGGGGGQPMHITVQVDGASGDDHIVSLVQQGVRAGLGEYDRALPDRVRQVNNDPRGRR